MNQIFSELGINFRTNRTNGSISTFLMTRVAEAFGNNGPLVADSHLQHQTITELDEHFEKGILDKLQRL